MTIRKINDNITRADLVVDRDFFNLRRTVVGYLHTISYHTSVLSVGRLGLGPLASGHWACRLRLLDLHTTFGTVAFLSLLYVVLLLDVLTQNSKLGLI